MKVVFPALLWAEFVTGFSLEEIIPALTPELEEEIMWGYNRWVSQQPYNHKPVRVETYFLKVPPYALEWAARQTGFTAMEILSSLTPDLEYEIIRSYDCLTKRRQ